MMQFSPEPIAAIARDFMDIREAMANASCQFRYQSIIRIVHDCIGHWAHTSTRSAFSLVDISGATPLLEPKDYDEAISVTQTILNRLAQAPIVPLIQTNDTDTAVRTAIALRNGGLTVMEVVLRTDTALQCLEAVAATVPGIAIGAGSVLTVDQARSVEAAGAQFIVCPGLDDAIVHHCAERTMPIFPGVVTPGEVQRAYALGLRTVKFFPAELAGGVPMLKALGSVFRDMRFMPTGGVAAGNLGEYLALPHVFACGGSWLTPKNAIAAGDYDTVIRLAHEAVTIAAQVR
ncbi:MAG: bifunctional 4-hydroxy-2-oxoglutarate aldolase/2-dehydro-3-deoxy-phosphogluconate aldolase [Pontixanthobacter sp.]